MVAFFAFAFAVVTAASPGAMANVEEERGQILVSLSHVEAHYAEALDEREVDELEELEAMVASAARWTLQRPGEVRRLAPKLQRLHRLLDRREAPDRVTSVAKAVFDELARVEALEVAPPSLPSLHDGERLYGQMCAQCHEAKPGMKPEVAIAMRPSPPSFFAPDVMRVLSPFKAFTVITHGLEGSPMPSFQMLPASDRWAIAFYLFTLRQPDCRRVGEGLALAVAAVRTDQELEAAHGTDALACLRKMAEPSAVSGQEAEPAHGVRTPSRAATVDGRSGDTLMRGTERRFEPTARVHRP